MPFELAIGDAAVCIPAKDEAERIGRLLTSLSLQSVASPSCPLKIVVVCNNCSDETASIARGFVAEPTLAIRTVEVDLPSEKAHVGTARRIAMDTGAAWLDETGRSDGVLLSTDADAIAPTMWVAANLAALMNAEAVGGRLVIADDNEETSPATARLHERIQRYWAAVRDLEDCLDPPADDPAPRHGDHTGASLALRVSTCRRVGGVPAIPSGEDNALVAAVEKSGGRIRHCPDVWIDVSAREAGRANGGMANEMTRRRLTAASDGQYELPTAAFWRDRLLRRAAFRREWVNDGAFINAIAHIAHREAAMVEAPAPVQPIDKVTAALEAMAHRCRRGQAA